MGEASDVHAETDGLPLRPYSKGGSIHTRTLRSLFVSRGQVMTWNTIACRPPNNRLTHSPYEYAAIHSCRSIRDERIENFRRLAAEQQGVKTPVIVALGDVAFRALTGIDLNAVDATGHKDETMKKMGMNYVRGYPVSSVNGIIVPTYRPEDVRSNTKLMPVLAEDYRKAFRIAQNGLEFLPVDSIVSPSPSQVRDLKERVLALDPNASDQWLIFDFETDDMVKGRSRNYTPPLQSVQFSLGPQHAVFLPWNYSTYQVIREILGSPCRKGGHNVWDFDLGVAANNQIPVGGIVDDTLFMFHHYQPDLTVEDSGTEADKDFRYSTAAGLQYVASFYGADSAPTIDGAGRQRPGWKHLRTSSTYADQALYGNYDVAMNARILYGCKGYPSLPQQMKELKIWDGYERYVRQFYPLMQRAAERGIPIDRPGQFAMDADLATVQVQIDTKMQGVHPDMLKKREPINGYVRPPKVGDKVRVDAEGVYSWLDEGEDVTVDVQKDIAAAEENDAVITGVWRPMKQEVFYGQKFKERRQCACLHVPGGDCITANHAGCVSVSKTGAVKVKKGVKALGGKRAVETCGVCRGKGMYTTDVVRDVTRWAKILPFRPSNKQLAAYITHRKHKLPVDKKTQKVSTAAKKVQELAKRYKDPLYQLILDSRTVGKFRSTYLTGNGWVERAWVKKDDEAEGAKATELKLGPIIRMEQQPPRIHTQFTLGPATGQTSSRRPNVQNLPKHLRNVNLKDLDLPKRFRGLIKARPGHRIWEFDLKSAHILTMGLEARDKDWMRLARIDAHSWFTSVLAHKRGLWPAPVNTNLTDADLTTALKEVRAYVVPAGPHAGLRFEQDIRDVTAKPAILGIQFGMQGYKLWENNKDSFENEYDAQNTINLFFEHRPLLKKYQEDVMAEAHSQRCLVSRGGFMRWFWHVYDFVYDPRVEGNYKIKHGDDAEDAKAFRPANVAFAYLRDACIRLDEAGILERGNYINNVHDSLVFEMPIELEDELVPRIRMEMEHPQSALGDPVVAPEGLWIEVDASCGADWGSLKKVKF